MERIWILFQGQLTVVRKAQVTWVGIFIQRCDLGQVYLAVLYVFTCKMGIIIYHMLSYDYFKGQISWYVTIVTDLRDIKYYVDLNFYCFQYCQLFFFFFSTLTYWVRLNRKQDLDWWPRNANFWISYLIYLTTYVIKCLLSNELLK